jgi:hypothetical protein
LLQGNVRLARLKYECQRVKNGMNHHFSMHTVMNAPVVPLHSRCHRDISIADNAVITLILEKRVGWNGYHTSIKTA